MAKISQIKLTDKTYEIDVSSKLKATTIINETDVKKVATVEAVKAPDGTHSLFDENNKITSAYLSDTILGQLKFGGTVCCDLTKANTANVVYWNITPSTLLKQKIQEEFYEYKDSDLLALNVGVATGINFLSSAGLTTSNINFLDGFYFIMGTSDPEVVSSSGLVPSFVVGDWMLICDNQIQKIDNTDTITHIKDADTSLLSIEGSGLKLNGITAIHPDYSDEVIDQINIETPISVSYGMTYIGSDIINRYGGKIQTGDVSYGLGTLKPGTLDLQSNTAYLKVKTTAAGDLGTHTEITPDKISINTINQETGIAEAYTFMAPGRINTDGSISGQEVHAETKMTAPTITNKEDRSQVVNLEYFEDNSSKVDWEHIDSEVHVINNHNVEIDGNLKVNNTLISSKAESIYTWNVPIVVSDYPSSFDNPEIWRGSDYNATDPYWTAYEVKAGYTYRVGVVEYQSYPSTRYSTVLIYDQVGGNLIGQTEGIVFDNFSFLVDGVSAPQIYNGLTFTAPVSGIAYIGSNGGSAPYLNSGVESTPASGQVKINGDLEVTGDLSFGADSHLVFGTIDGTNFVADYAKVKNAPVEDDDVVNLKTLKEWVPSTTKKEKIYEATQQISNFTTRQTFWGTEAIAGTYIFEYTGAEGSVIKAHVDFSPSGEIRTLTPIIDEWTVSACSPAAVGSTSDYPIQVIENDAGYITFSTDFCGCESFGTDPVLTIYRQASTTGGSSDISDYQGNAKINGNLEITGNLKFDGDLEMSSIVAQKIKVTSEPINDTDVINKAYFEANKGSGIPMPDDTVDSWEGAFLRIHNGQAVWEMLPCAEDYSF